MTNAYRKAFRRQPNGHFVVTIREMGWSGKQNGELLALMQIAGFEVLVTVDQNLRYQQNLAASSISLLVMIAKTNKLQASFHSPNPSASPWL